MERNAITFFNEFKKRVTEKDFLDKYKNNSQFTEVVIKVINAIIEDMGYQSQNEYFRIDATGWKSRYETIEKEAKEIGMKPHLWDLKIAVEHENNVRDWTDELIKLIHIRCPLKVIIGYNYCDRRDTLEYKKLEYAAKWMREINVFDSNSNEDYLIILGNCCGKDKGSSYDKFDYKGYLYNYENQKFQPI